MSEPNPSACPVCREPAHGHHSECPGMQTGGAMLDALLATRKVLREVYDKPGNPNAVHACGKISDVLAWPKTPLKDL